MLLLAPPVLVDQAHVQVDHLRDFKQTLQWMRTHYAWAERFDWVGLQREYEPRVRRAADGRAFHQVMEAFLDEFADAHTHLGSNLNDSWRLPPGDIAAEWRGGQAWVVAVRPGSRAEATGLHAGARLLQVDGRLLAEGVEAKRPRFVKTLTEVDRHWMLNALLAGRHEAAQRLQVEMDGNIREFAIPAGPDPDSPRLETCLLPGGIGYIAFPELGSKAQLQRFDEAVARFPEARAWVLDLRHNTGGDTAVMKPLVGRFLRTTTPFVLMRRRHGQGLGAAWRESVSPCAPRIEGPLAVLVSPWTESVAESLAMVVQQSGRGRVFGTRMAGLNAAVSSLTLRHSKLRVQASVEPIYDLAGRPRSAFRPEGLVDLSRPSTGDAVLQAAIRWIEQGLGASPRP